jgi:hypothetical protein
VEEEQTEVEEAARDPLSVDKEVLLDQVPAARANDERRKVVVEPVLLAVWARELDGAFDRVDDVGVAGHHVVPGR